MEKPRLPAADKRLQERIEELEAYIEGQENDCNMWWCDTCKEWDIPVPVHAPCGYKMKRFKEE